MYLQRQLGWGRLLLEAVWIGLRRPRKVGWSHKVNMNSFFEKSTFVSDVKTPNVFVKMAGPVQDARTRIAMLDAVSMDSARMERASALPDGMASIAH